MAPILDEHKCSVCGTCYQVCPQDVFSLRGDDPPLVAYPDECWHCAACVLDCPNEALHLELPLQMRIIPSPALYGPPATGEEEMLRKAAAFTRSVVR